MKKAIIGIAVFLIVVIVGVSVSFIMTNSSNGDPVYGAVGGGKENLLNDSEFNKILNKTYKIDVKNETWSNTKLIKDKLTSPTRQKDGNYDFIFFSDQRFYEYYKTPAQDDEAPRERILDGSIALNTPIVIYSWAKVADALSKEGIVTVIDDVYYISDMTKLLNYISERKPWSELGLNEIYGNINITSTDPVTSTPGATYYGLLASIMNNGYVDENNINNVLPQLKSFYKLSGYMGSTPADLFDQYLRTGMGAKPLVVDYEKSIIDFACLNPDGYEQIKNEIRILYPKPTIWNSHCVISLTEKGDKYITALKDKQIQDLAWTKYGFRTGITGGSYSVKDISVQGIPQNIYSVVQGLNKEIYDEIISELKASKNN